MNAFYFGVGGGEIKFQPLEIAPLALDPILNAISTYGTCAMYSSTYRTYWYHYGILPLNNIKVHRLVLPLLV